MLDAVQGAATTEAVVEAADALVLGTGFAGICAAVRLRQAGLSFLMLEKAQEIGGTWRDNTYPGCACDVPSHLYSLSFAPKTDWSRMYATQPEIHAYLHDVVGKFALGGHVRFGAQVRAAEWIEGEARWRVTTTDGRRFTARFLFAGLGPLHIPIIPEIPGQADFAGAQFHSATWDHSVPLRDRRVAVIGTGASAIQFVPEIAGEASSLTVFQRTPAWIIPRPDRAFSPRHHRRMRSGLARRVFRFGIYFGNEIRALGFLGNRVVRQAGEAMARRHLAAQIPDPALRRKLTPDYRIGCKRVLISNDFYPALMRPNVSVETSGIAEIRAHSILCRDGTEHPADAIIYGTGFHTTDGIAIDIIGRGGQRLDEAFRSGMHAYRGVTVPGFPNLFLLLGPNTGLGHNSVVLMIEAQVRYALSLIRGMRRHGWQAAEIRDAVERAWNDRLHERMRPTVWMQGGCRSWYLDANGRNTTIWPGFVAEYQLRMRRARLADYARVA